METLDFLNKFFNSETFFNWIILIGYMTIVFYVANLLSDIGNKILNRAGIYKPNNLKAYIGVPIHEFGHWIFAVLFQFKIKEAKFFPTKPTESEKGRITLGYVNYSVRNDMNMLVRSLGLTLVSIGPIFSGSFVIIVLGKLLCNNKINEFYNFIQESFKTETYTINYIMNNFDELLNIFTSNITITYIIFIILSVIIADFMTLSGSDLKNFYKGLLFLTLPILLASFVPILSTKIGMFFGICVSYVTFFGVLSLCGQIINIFYSSFRYLIKKIIVDRR